MYFGKEFPKGPVLGKIQLEVIKNSKTLIILKLNKKNPTNIGRIFLLLAEAAISILGMWDYPFTS